MDKIKDFILKHKFIIAVIVLICLIIFVLVSSRFSVEGMEVTSLSKFVNKDIYLKFSDGNKSYYLSVASNATCGLPSDKDECSNNVVILQENPDKFSRMILSFNPYSPLKRYTILSSLKDIQPPYPQLAQSLNYRGVNKLCFDSSTLDDVISFDIEEVSGKYRIKYKKDNEYYYIGLCDNNVVCNNSKRLCVYKDQSRAITFEIDSAPVLVETETPKQTEKFNPVNRHRDHHQEQHQEHKHKHKQKHKDDHDHKIEDDFHDYISQGSETSSLEGYDNNPLKASNIDF